MTMVTLTHQYGRSSSRLRVEDSPLKAMCPMTAMTKPVSGAMTRTMRLRARRPKARPRAVIEVKSGWPNEVSAPRSTTICLRAASGSPASMVTLA